MWRLEAAAFISFKAKDAAPSGWVTPYQDYYFLLTVPHFLHERLRLELRPSYTSETTQLYYGLGNASVAPLDEIPAATSTAGRIRRSPPGCAGTSWAMSSSSSAPPTPRTGSSSTRRARSPPT